MDEVNAHETNQITMKMSTNKAWRGNVSWTNDELLMVPASVLVLHNSTTDLIKFWSGRNIWPTLIRILPDLKNKIKKLFSIFKLQNKSYNSSKIITGTGTITSKKQDVTSLTFGRQTNVSSGSKLFLIGIPIESRSSTRVLICLFQRSVQHN